MKYVKRSCGQPGCHIVLRKLEPPPSIFFFLWLHFEFWKILALHNLACLWAHFNLPWVPWSLYLHEGLTCILLYRSRGNWSINFGQGFSSTEGTTVYWETQKMLVVFNFLKLLTTCRSHIHFVGCKSYLCPGQIISRSCKIGCILIKGHPNLTLRLFLMSSQSPCQLCILNSLVNTKSIGKVLRRFSSVMS